MPPKNKDKKDKKKTEKEIILDGKNISKMSPEGLVRHLIHEVSHLHEVKKQRGFEEQERDIMFRKLEHARDELTKYEAQLLCQEKAMDDCRVRQSAELQVFRQRANHLRYELDNDLETTKLDQDHFSEEMANKHLRSMGEIARQHNRNQTKHSDELKAAEQHTKEMITITDRKYETSRENYWQASLDHTEDLEAQRSELEEDAQLDITNYTTLLDQRRLEHITNLQNNFEKNFHEIKQYFQELTYHNLIMIQDLTKQSEKLKEHLRELYTRYHSILKQTEMSREPVRIQTKHLAALKQQAEAYEKEKFSLDRLQHNYAGLQKERVHLIAEITNYDNEFHKVQADYKELKESFAGALSEVKQIVGADASYTREKAVHLKAQVDELKCALREVILVNPDSKMEEHLYELQLVEQQYQHNVATKKDLQRSLTKMAKLYNDSLITMRYIIEEYGLPVENGQLELEPLMVGVALKPAEIGRISVANSGF